MVEWGNVGYLVPDINLGVINYLRNDKKHENNIILLVRRFDIPHSLCDIDYVT